LLQLGKTKIQISKIKNCVLILQCGITGCLAQGAYYITSNGEALIIDLGGKVIHNLNQKSKSIDLTPSMFNGKGMYRVVFNKGDFCFNM
jgi:hypothetical protein